MMNMKKFQNMLKDPQTLQLAIVVLLGVVLFCMMKNKKKKSNYLNPMPVKLVGNPENPDIFSAEYSTDCVPGPQPTAGYYTRGLSPGGYCGVQKMVANSANYKLEPGELEGTLI